MEEGDKRVTVGWWKVPMELIKFCVFRVNPLWTFSTAAAFIGFVFLGKRLYDMKKKAKALKIKATMDDKGDGATNAVKELLPEDEDLPSLCSWADHVKFRYKWSSPLHYIDTPDNLCTYNYLRDCKDANGVKDRCVAGAINNYTSQLLTYGNSNKASTYNLTKALLFLSHFVGDIHQPLHVGFTSDKGGNTIDVHWYTRKAVLHHVWDDSIIETAEERFYDSDVSGLVKALQKNITGAWSDQVSTWEACSNSKQGCPDVYFSLRTAHQLLAVSETIMEQRKHFYCQRHNIKISHIF